MLGIAQGRTNAEIAAELAMSVPTVKAHITHILTKLPAATAPRSPCWPMMLVWPDQPADIDGATHSACVSDACVSDACVK